MDHPLLRHLLPLDSDDPPSERRAAVFRAYEEATGEQVRDPLDGDSAMRVREWLVRSEMETVDSHGYGPALMLKKASVTRALIHSDVASKASHLTQAKCLTCVPAAVSPHAITFAIHASPFSAQSLSSARLRTLKTKIAESRRAQFGSAPDWTDQTLCVRVAAVLGSGDRNKDADNLVKGLLDALQGSAYENDAAISHLSVHRLRHDGSEGYYTVTIRPVLDALEDVIDRVARVHWLTGQELIEP